MGPGRFRNRIHCLRCEAGGEKRTHDYSTYRISFAPQKYLNPTAVEDGLPKALAAIVNYPNPFNPTTTIEYTMPENSLVDIVIYNIMGQEIRSLVSGHQQKGTHTVVWDGSERPRRSGFVRCVHHPFESGRNG